MNLEKVKNTKQVIQMEYEVSEGINNEEAKDYLPKFINWLKKQVASSNELYSLESKKLILYKASPCKPELMFILPEVLDDYCNLTKINPEIIKYELKRALGITFSYTIVKDEKIIEILPCKALSGFLSN